MSDNLKSVFAENLRVHSARFPSIAHICRGTGINRQQYNKYLSGKFLPNPRTRKVLCEFLGVQQAELFGAPLDAAKREQQTADFRQDNLNRIVESGELLRLLSALGLSSSMNHTRLLDGFYFCYFPMQSHSEFLVRSALKVTSKNGVRFFTRHTNFVSVAFPSKSLASGRHVGLVVGNDAEFCLLGIRQLTLPHLSLLVFPSTQFSGSSIYAGTGLTRGANETHACRVCLEYLGKGQSAGRRALAGIGVISLRYKDVPSPVTSVMTASRDGSGVQVSPLSFETSLLTQFLYKDVGTDLHQGSQTGA